LLANDISIPRKKILELDSLKSYIKKVKTRTNPHSFSLFLSLYSVCDPSLSSSKITKPFEALLFQNA